MIIAFSLILLERQTLAENRGTEVIPKIEISNRVDESTKLIVTETGLVQDLATKTSVIAIDFMKNGVQTEKANRKASFIKKLRAERTLVSTADYERMIRQKCAQFGCNSQQIIRVMYCESSGNKYAQNGRYFGLFQHDQHAWASRTSRYGVPGASIFDPYAQIVVSTRMFSEGMASAWSCK